MLTVLSTKKNFNSGTNLVRVAVGDFGSDLGAVGNKLAALLKLFR